MPNVRTQFEQSDLTGLTKIHAGTVGTTAITFSESGRPIAEVLLNSQRVSSPTATLQFSFDGVTYHTIKRNTILGWSPRGGPTTLYLKASAASTEYDLIVNYEDADAI